MKEIPLSLPVLLSHVFIGANDPERSARFYRPLLARLGWRERFTDAQLGRVGWKPARRRR